MLHNRSLLLIITGGIAAYKSLDLIRRLKDRGASVRCILTRGGKEFVTPLSVGALSGAPVFEELFSLKDETEMGHIRLAREADLILVAPASADFLARMVHGVASDLATACLLAATGPVMVAPAMNTAMWEHPATQENMDRLAQRGVLRVGPGAGDLACGEVGEGRMAEVADIVDAVETYFGAHGSLKGRHAVVTSGPTHEPIDPVRYIANRSSGKQGHAIAGALAKLGAEVDLISGPVELPDPKGLRTIHVETAAQMLAAVEGALPADIAVCAAAVADWRVADVPTGKIKKEKGVNAPSLTLVENPDILATLSALDAARRPSLVVGFAAETDDVIENATAKRARKSCDWIVANDVSPASGTFGGDDNTVHVIDADGAESWELMSKTAVADALAARIAAHFKEAS